MIFIEFPFNDFYSFVLYYLLTCFNASPFDLHDGFLFWYLVIL